MTDRLTEIRARLDKCERRKVLSSQYPSDIAWLIRELERWKRIAKNDLYGMCWCDAPRPDCCTCPGARGDMHRDEVRA